jgi:hypothetical protein
MRDDGLQHRGRAAMITRPILMKIRLEQVRQGRQLFALHHVGALIESHRHEML